MKSKSLIYLSFTGLCLLVAVLLFNTEDNETASDRSAEVEAAARVADASPKAADGDDTQRLVVAKII